MAKSSSSQVGLENLTESKSAVNENVFTDYSQKSWFRDKLTVKVGNSIAEILSGKVMSFEVAKLLNCSNFKTFKILVTKDNQFFLLKSVKELK